MVYGAFTSNVDMRTGSPAFGTPEYVKGAIASGQMARRYGLPWRSSNATASAVVDAQAAYESEMAVWGAVMGGVNLLYQGAGWLEGGLTASYEKLIVDAEILQMMSEVLQPVVVDEASLGLDAIAEVGPGGHFFGSAHTLERFETAFYRPILSDWRNFETWAGRRRADRDGAGERRSGSSCSPSSSRRRSTPARAEAIDAFVARRKREIGGWPVTVTASTSRSGRCSSGSPARPRSPRPTWPRSGRRSPTSRPTATTSAAGSSGSAGGAGAPDPRAGARAAADARPPAEGQMSAVHDHGTWVAISPIVGTRDAPTLAGRPGRRTGARASSSPTTRRSAAPRSRRCSRRTTSTTTAISPVAARRPTS